MIVTPQESDSSASSTNGTPEHRSPYKVAARTPSPRKTASFIAALLSAMRMGPKSKGNTHLGTMSPCNGVTQVNYSIVNIEVLGVTVTDAQTALQN